MSLDNEAIVKMLDDFDKDSKALKKSLFRLCWYMRGGLSIDEAFQLGYAEREIINEIIKDNLETTKETRMPFF